LSRRVDKRRPTALAVLVVVILTVTAGCGSTDQTTSTPSPSQTTSSATGRPACSSALRDKAQQQKITDHQLGRSAQAAAHQKLVVKQGTVVRLISRFALGTHIYIPSTLGCVVSNRLGDNHMLLSVVYWTHTGSGTIGITNGPGLPNGEHVGNSTPVTVIAS
jgi:hypothetical protein